MSPDVKDCLKVTLATLAAPNDEGKTVWYHLNHCCMAQEPGRTLRAAPTEEKDDEIDAREEDSADA